MKPSERPGDGPTPTLLVTGLVVLATVAFIVPGGLLKADGTATRRPAFKTTGRPLARRALPADFSGSPASRDAMEDGQSSPVALAAGDLDEDGVPDLIAGYGGARAGILSVQFGNVDAIFPNSPEAQERRARGRWSDSPFLPAAGLTGLPAAPDFLAAGDFDGDDHLDVIACAREGDAFYLLRGDGKGALSPPRRVPLPGLATSLIAGEMNRPGGVPGVAVAVDGGGGSRLLIFDSLAGDAHGRPESYSLPERATAMALGRLDEDDWLDLAVAAGGDVWLLRGRDGGVSGRTDASLQPLLRGEAAAPPAILAIVLGDFDGDGHSDFARLSADGALRVGPLPRLPSSAEDVDTPEVVRLAPAPRAGGALLLRARISGRPGDDLVVLDDPGIRLVVLSGPDRRPEFREGAAGAEGADAATLRPWATIDLDGPPVAALAMRLNGDALSDLVVLEGAATAPVVLSTSPEAALAVTNTNNSGAGSLRQAILDANATSAADTISFNLAGNGPFIIQPLSALPATTFPVTIDGTTQPGFAGTPIVQIDGSLAGNGVHGLVVSGGTSTVRGLVIGRFGGTGVGDGIRLQGAGGDIIESLFIGTDATGTAARANTGSGVVVDGTASNTIGSTVAAGRNLLSGNASSGVVILGGLATANVVEGNFIGTRAGGGAALGNASPGVLVDGAPGNTIGISNVLPNVISGNGAEGVVIHGAAATGNLLRGNYIGTDASGAAAVRNLLAGIKVLSSNTTVGGSTVGQRNTIAFNGSNGVTVGGGTGNRLMRNPNFSNAALGIDLGGDGVTPNDAGDADPGPNGLQNAPVLVSATTDASSSTIAGTLNSRPGSLFTLEFFSSAECDPTGFGEGRQYFMSTTVTTDAGGNAGFNLSQPIPLPVRVLLTATATDSAGNTSEFSNFVRVSDMTPAEVTGESWSGATQLDWSDVSGATSYNLYRGLGTFLPNLLSSAMESCLRLSAAATSSGAVLTETPAAGSFYWYLVTGSNGFGEGTAGDATLVTRVLDSFGNCPACAHEKCTAGGPLSAGCDPCVAGICASAPSCCSTEWTGACVDLVLGVCGSLQCAASAGACPHQQCITGVALPAGCDSPPVSPGCIATVCGADPICCSTIWDATCVAEVGTECSKACN